MPFQLHHSLVLSKKCSWNAVSCACLLGLCDTVDRCGQMLMRVDLQYGCEYTQRAENVRNPRRRAQLESPVALCLSSAAHENARNVELFRVCH